MDDVLRKERMLVRADHTAREDLPASFDEQSSRRFPTQSSGWEEMAVVWKRRTIELWSESFSLFGGHKPKLKFKLPLNSHTRLSLFSSVDSILCLAHSAADPPQTAHTSATSTLSTAKPEEKRRLRELARFRHEGTRVYLFRARTNAVAKEWAWMLYSQLGGTAPDILDIAVPGLGTRIRIPIPEDVSYKAARNFTPRNELPGKPVARFSVANRRGERTIRADELIAACTASLTDVRDWRQIYEEVTGEGVQPRLCWRRGDVLDWVEDGPDAPPWSVVAGWALRQPQLDVQLELRLAYHYPNKVRVRQDDNALDSVLLEQPQTIEGFVRRASGGPGSAANTVDYLATRDAHLFFCKASTAHPPPPPMPQAESIANPAELVLAPFVLGFASIATGGKHTRKRDKVWRKVSGRTGWAKDQSMAVKASETQAGAEAGPEDRQAWLEREERKRAVSQILNARGYLDLRGLIVKRADGVQVTEEDEKNDLGGDEALAADGEHLHKQRSFSLELPNGREVRYECLSIAVASGWIRHLTALVEYWTRRELADNEEQMARHPETAAIVRQLRRQQFDLGATDESTSLAAVRDSPLLALTYNHCVLERDGPCRVVYKSGTVYVKKTARGTWKERQLFLLPATLLTFETTRRNLRGQPTQTLFHRPRGHPMSLRGCYVFSGLLSAPYLNERRAAEGWDPVGGKGLMRWYEDGLRSNDGVEDCTIVLWKKDREHKGVGKTGSTTIIRTRSKVERDQWVFVLNAAIDNLRSAERDREESLKEFPWLK